MNIKRIIQKLFGHKVVIEPIVDYNRYSNIDESYSGGSLADSNILIVTNTDIPHELIQSLQVNEKVTVAVLHPEAKLTQTDIINAASQLIGPFLHIINIYKKDETTSLMSADGSYPATDSMYQVYQWLQEEVSYLVPMNQYASICSAYIGDDSQYSEALNKNMDMCFRGLGEVMANHSIINNGIVASSTIPMSEVINTAVYMSSKYGQILTGEVLHLKD